jgi:coatomer protein complex subunit epsilon
VIADIKDSAPVSLQAVRALALYLSDAAAKAGVLAALEAWLNSVAAASDATVQAVAAIIYLHEGAFQPALRAVRSLGSLEALALAVQVHLRLDRPDLAEKQLRALGERDDESSLYQLSAAHVCLALGGADRCREAASLYGEMLQRYGDDSVGAVNGLAAAYIGLRRFDEAERVLTEAVSREGSGAGSNAETLVNFLSLLQHTGRGGSEGAAKMLAQLRKVAPGHPFVASLAIAEASFDRIAPTFALA